MHKSKGRKSGPPKRPGGGGTYDDPVERVKVHWYEYAAAVATQDLRNLNPSNMSVVCSRLTALADAFAHFRIVSLKFRAHANNAATYFAIGFVGGIQDVPPATLTDVMNLGPSVLQGPAQQVPSNWVKVCRQDLAGPFPWYKSLLGTADATEESPGLLVTVRSAASAPVIMECIATYEFKTPVSTANTPAAVRLAAEVRAARLLAIQSKEGAMLRKLLSAAVANPRNDAGTTSQTPGSGMA